MRCPIGARNRGLYLDSKTLSLNLCKISCFFFLQCKEGGFPNDLWLGVSTENVSVYKRGDPKPLETFQYEHIVFFGAPQPNTFKITVDEREMFFETFQVYESTRLVACAVLLALKQSFCFAGLDKFICNNSC